MAKLRFALLLFAFVPSCASDDDSAPVPGKDFPCHIGELTGTWRITYEEKDGDCGPIQAETVSLDSSSPGGTGGSCKFSTDIISDDKCRYDFDYVCPTTDGKGTVQWTGVTRQ